MKDWEVGLLAGLTVAVGGAIKDAPYEGFDEMTFIRSPVVGMIVGEALGKSLDIHGIVLYLASIAGERIITEMYKIMIRKKPGKFEFGEWGTRLKHKKTGEEI